MGGGGSTPAEPSYNVRCTQVVGPGRRVQRLRTNSVEDRRKQENKPLIMHLVLEGLLHRSVRGCMEPSALRLREAAMLEGFDINARVEWNKKMFRHEYYGEPTLPRMHTDIQVSKHHSVGRS